MINYKIRINAKGHIELYFPFKEYKEYMQMRFSGSSFDWTQHCWTVPYRSFNIRSAKDLAAQFSLRIEPEKWLNPEVYSHAVLEPLLQESTALEPARPLPRIPGMRGSLLPFQQAGVGYALKRKKCLIADPPGAGKTIMALATIALANVFPLVVLCPNPEINSWKNEISHWFPTWKVQELTGGAVRPGQNAYLIGYSRIRKYLEFFKDIKRLSFIFDESHNLRGYKSQRVKQAGEIARNADYRLLISSTPLINGVSDLMSQLKVMGRWDVFIGTQFFSETYCGALYGFGDRTPDGATNLDQLERSLRIYCMIQRSEHQLEPFLPGKKIIPIYLQPDSRITNHWLENPLLGSQDYGWLRKNAYEVKKAEVILWLKHCKESGGKTVVFGFHTSYLKELAKIFSAPLLTGDCSPGKMLILTQKFKEDPSVNFLFATYGTGGQGWQFGFADRIVLIEPDWSESTHLRASGRLSRLGDSRRINTYQLLAVNTLEDHMLKIAQGKQDVFDKIFR